MVDFPSSVKSLEALNTLALTLQKGNTSSGTSIIVSSGDGIVSPDTTAGTGNVLNLAGGDNTGGLISDTGGDVSITGGGANGGPGGAVVVAGGDSTSVTGGTICLSPGTGPGGDGLVFVTRSGIQMIERVAVPGPAFSAGQGRLWIRDDVPNLLIFTNDEGANTFLAPQGEGVVPNIGIRIYHDVANRSCYSGGATSRELVTGNSSTFTAVTTTSGYHNFDGSTSRVNYGTLDSSQEDIFSGGGYVSALARPESSGEGTPPDDAGRIVSTEGPSSSDGWTIFFTQQTGSLVRFGFKANFSTQDGVWFTDQIFSINEWHLVEVEYDSDSATNNPILTVNGTSYSVGSGLTENLAPSGSYQSDSGNLLFVGDRENGDRSFDGDIESVWAYDRIISSEERTVFSNLFTLRHGTIGTGSGTTLAFTSVQSSGPYAASAGENVIVDVSGGGFEVDLPSTPNADDQIGIKFDNESSNTLTIDGNGNTVEDPVTAVYTATVSVSANGPNLIYQFDANTSKWRLV